MSRRFTFTCAVSTLLISSAAFGQSESQPDLYKAYYLERQANDFPAAMALYRKVLDGGATDEVKRAARSGADRCRDALAAADFAVIMPPDAIGYVALNRPGRLAEQLAEMVGLTTDDMQSLLAVRPSRNSGKLAYIPPKIAVSPAVFEHFSMFGGVAAAITDFDPQGGHPPAGVLVIHHGDMVMLKGVIETAFQFAPTAEKVRDMPTFGADVPELGRVTGVLTESLFIVGTSAELVQGVVDRLIGARDDGLGAREDVRDALALRKDATVFAFCDLQKLVPCLTRHLASDDQRELRIVDALVDLDGLRNASLAVGVRDGALGVDFALRFADDHRCIAYNLLRLPPMSRQCLAAVPADAAAIVGLGLNPALAQAVADAAKPGPEAAPVSAFDLLREFCGNIREVVAFVVPGEARKGIPNACVLMAVNDAGRARAVWNQFLGLPGLAGPDGPIEPKELEISGVAVTSYAIPEFGNVYLSEFGGCVAIGFTRNAVKAAIRAVQEGKSALKDEIVGAALSALPEDTTFTIVAHAGRIAQAMAGHAGNQAEAMQANVAAQLCSRTIASLAVAQGPSQITVRCNLRGLPDVNEALEKFSPMLNAFIPKTPPATKDRAEEKIVRKQRLPAKTETSQN